jgi:alpha-tubulin suppressor-like RCC1 family protein
MLTSAGGVQCWGDNEWGELGNGSTTNSPVPVGVSGLSLGVAAIAAGGFHTCALTSPGGGVQCWGDNGEGELGNDSTAESLVPVGVAGWSLGVAAIAAGGFHSCVLAFGGGVQCWGDDMFGQLGNDSTVNSVVPVGVFGLSSGVTAIAAGGEHTCALTWAGGVQCWGLNSNGQLGNDSTASSGVPVRVGGP